MTTYLIADASMVMRTILRYMIERCEGTVVAESRDRDEAVAMTRQHRPDALAMSNTLRGEEGLATLAAIRQDGWHGKVFLLMSGDKAAAAAAARQAGVDGVFYKPFELTQVSGEIRRVLAIPPTG